MQTATIGYDTAGLPQFGGATIASSEAAKIEKLNNLFNTFVGQVKEVVGHGTPLQSSALGNFAEGIEAGYWPLYNCITRKGMVN